MFRFVKVTSELMRNVLYKFSQSYQKRSSKALKEHFINSVSAATFLNHKSSFIISWTFKTCLENIFIVWYYIL